MIIYRKHKRGDVREDGRIFYNYTKQNGKRYPVWLTPESFEKTRQRRKEYRSENKDAIFWYTKNYYKKSKDRINEARRVHRTKRPEVYKEQDKKRRALYGDKLNRRNKEYRRINADRIKQSRRDRYSQDRIKYISRVAARRDLVKGHFRSLDKDSQAIVRVMYELRDRISKCIGIPHEVDHVVPLKPRDKSKSGRHEPSNLRVIPKTINAAKGNRLFSTD